MATAISKFVARRKSAISLSLKSRKSEGSKLSEAFSNGGGGDDSAPLPASTTKSSESDGSGYFPPSTSSATSSASSTARSFTRTDSIESTTEEATSPISPTGPEDDPENWDIMGDDSVTSALEPFRELPAGSVSHPGKQQPTGETGHPDPNLPRTPKRHSSEPLLNNSKALAEPPAVQKRAPPKPLDPLPRLPPQPSAIPPTIYVTPPTPRRATFSLDGDTSRESEDSANGGQHDDADEDEPPSAPIMIFRASPQVVIPKSKPKRHTSLPQTHSQSEEPQSAASSVSTKSWTSPFKRIKTALKMKRPVASPPSSPPAGVVSPGPVTKPIADSPVEDEHAQSPQPVSEVQEGPREREAEEKKSSPSLTEKVRRRASIISLGKKAKAATLD